MSETKVISVRIDSELLAFVDAEADRRRWSRNSTIVTSIEFGLPEVEREPLDKPRTTAGLARESALEKLDVPKVAAGIAKKMGAVGTQKNPIAPPRISMGADLAVGPDYGVAVVTKDGEVVSETFTGLSGTPINKEPFRPKPTVRQIMYIPEEPAPVQENSDGCPHGFNTRKFCITMQGGCK